MGMFDFVGKGINGIGSALGLDGKPSTAVYTPDAYNNSASNLYQNLAQNNPNWGAQQAQSNPLLSGIFGSGGTMGQAEKQANDLQNTGFSLQANDNTAFGQAQNQAAQLYGQQGSSLANSLAQRGFGSGASGSAGAQFSGLAGNKNEALAQAQSTIANQRMNFAQNALNQTRQAVTQMGALGNQAGQNAWNNLAGAGNQYNSNYSTEQGAKLAGFENAQGNTNPTLGQYIGAGVGGGATNAAGGLTKSLLGGGVSSLGGQQGLGGTGTASGGGGGNLSSLLGLAAA